MHSYKCIRREGTRKRSEGIIRFVMLKMKSITPEGDVHRRGNTGEGIRRFGILKMKSITSEGDGIGWTSLVKESEDLEF